MNLDEIRSGLAETNAKRSRLLQKIESVHLDLAQQPGGEEAQALQKKIAELRAESVRLRERASNRFAQLIDPRELVAQLDGAIPILLVPLRIQTRFRNTPNGRVLLIRVYPDDISVERHEPRLSTTERGAGESFWAAPVISEDPEIPDRKALWRGIVARFNLHRAAWIIKATNPEAPQDGEVLDVPLRVPAVWTLPERLAFRLYGESDRFLTEEFLGTPIPDGLEMGLDPTEAGLGFNRENGNLDYPEKLRWQVDFGEAIKVGLGVEIPLSQIGNPLRIERIMVVGVRLATDEKKSAALLERMIEGHSYTEGFSFVPQGTPTNVTNDSDAPAPADVDETLARLTGPGAYEDDGAKTLYEDECDGLRLAHALGLSAEAMRYIEHAGQEDGREAIAMKRALWAGTLGYYAQQMLAPMLEDHGGDNANLTEQLILAGRFFFTHFVFGRGPLPAFRIGAQPYGVLPVSADTLRSTQNVFEPWSDGFIDFFLFQLHQKMATLARTWIDLSQQIPRAGAGADANARLLDVLASQASSVEWHSERLVGPEYLKNYTDFKNQGLGMNTPYNQYLSQLTQRSNAADAAFPGLFPFIPRIFELSFLGGYWRNIVDELDQQVKGLDRGLTTPLTGDVIDHQPYSEVRGLDPSYPNYIAWLAKASFDEVRRGLSRTNTEGKSEPVTALLYMALRHSLLYEQAFLAMRLFRRFQPRAGGGRPYAWSDFAEKEIYNVQYLFDGTYWDYLTQNPPNQWPLGGPGAISGSVLDLIQSRDKLRRELPDWKTYLGDMDEVSRALKLFAQPDFPTARLERLFAEHMDLSSYRLDAWAIGYVYQRLLSQRVWREETREGRINPLRQHRDDNPPLRYDLNLHPLGPYSQGIYLGAYGWVEGIVADPKPSEVEDLPPELAPQNGGSVTRDADNYGFIHAPSLNHAVTSAVLRSASVTQPDTFAFNVDLSSARTRDALWIVDGVRQGQSPAALLGYRFERGMRDRNPALQQWLPQLRATFPMPRQSDTDPGPAEAIPAHDVVNGLLIIQARRDGTLAGKLSFAGVDAAVITGIADTILDTFDACGDLMLAESVHQAAQGNYDRAGGVVTAAGEFTHVPAEFEVTRTPRSGTALSHRVLLAMDAPPPADADLRSPRARLEPGLNEWIGSLIGPLNSISSKLTYTFQEDDESEVITVTYDQLGLEPIDLLFVADNRVASDLNGRLDRVARAQFEAAHPDTPIQIVIDTTGAAESVVMLDAIRKLLLAARPGTLRDFVAPSTLHRLDRAAIDGIDEEELIQRVLGVSRLDPEARNAQSLWASFEALLARVDDAGADPDAVLVEAAAFGIPEAVPTGEDAANQLKRVKPILVTRHNAALAKWTPFKPPAKNVLQICREITDILLGTSFPLMPRLTLPAALPAAVMPPDDPDAERIADWLFQTSVVREGVRNLQTARILGQELGTPLAAMQLIQWPESNRNWIALPLLAGASLTGDPVSIAIQPAGAFDPSVPVAALVIDEWSETIPPTDETTGLAFHYDAPNAEPPQAVLLAVSERLSANNRRWTWNEVVGCVEQALLLAKIRCVGPDEIRRTRLDPVLPATLAAETTFPATISTSWFANVVKEVATLQQDFLKRT